MDGRQLRELLLGEPSGRSEPADFIAEQL
jgi:hypothetical protein